MPIIPPQYAAKLVYLLGFSNVILLLLIFFSCRCLMGKTLGNYLLKYSWFKKLCALHCYLWWFFFLSVLLHTLIAFDAFGSPF